MGLINSLMGMLSSPATSSGNQSKTQQASQQQTPASADFGPSFMLQISETALNAGDGSSGTVDSISLSAYTPNSSTTTGSNSSNSTDSVFEQLMASLSGGSSSTGSASSTDSTGSSSQPGSLLQSIEQLLASLNADLANASSSQTGQTPHHHHHGATTTDTAASSNTPAATASDSTSSSGTTTTTTASDASSALGAALG